MDKLDRLLLKAKKQTRTEDYIAWAIVHPKDPQERQWEAEVVFNQPDEHNTLQSEKRTFNTKKDATDYISKMADEHGQEEVTIIHFTF